MKTIVLDSNTAEMNGDTNEVSYAVVVDDDFTLAVSKLENGKTYKLFVESSDDVTMTVTGYTVNGGSSISVIEGKTPYEISLWGSTLFFNAEKTP